MNPIRHAAWLRIALVVLGLICAVGFYPLTVFWPSGWAWHEGHSDYLEMIIALRDAWRLPAAGRARSGAAPQPHLLRALVERGAWRSH